MDLKQYYSVIVKRLSIVILLPIAASLICGFVSFYIIKPVYESDLTVYVINKRDNAELTIAYNDVMVSQQLVNDYREFIKSRAVTQKVIDEMGLENLTPGKLGGKISVNSKNNTRLIEIRVRDTDPKRASDIANTIGSVFMEKVADIMKTENISIVDKALKPDRPIWPHPLFNTAVAFLAGLLIAVGLAFLIEYLDDSIKTQEDVEKYLELVVIGDIPVFSMA